MKAVEQEPDKTHERFLIEAAQRDPNCFAELYESNFERVYAYIARRVGDREEAQDLTAETFHQALVSIGQFEWRGVPFVAWLLGIAAKVLSKKWQRAAKQHEVPTDDLEWAGVDDKTEQNTILFHLVGGLLPEQRLVIMRRFVDQRSIREIAQELGRTEGAVKQLQLRALQNLRTRIKE